MTASDAITGPNAEYLSINTCPLLHALPAEQEPLQFPLQFPSCSSSDLLSPHFSRVSGDLKEVGYQPVERDRQSRSSFDRRGESILTQTCSGHCVCWNKLREVLLEEEEEEKEEEEEGCALTC
ncbi:unnamed protein product [Pleuronectes platessa]|uniref:Uncharacterized protein n=1 Tax=Pleuronectes platessa TaxID=8262 RepID=A0A9N7VFP1_PLEPL|nr:unnamed protein product [Pleuronectes platessa]